jgi:hypothetical protein
MMLVWGVAAGAAVANPFPSPLWIKVALLATAACFAAVGLARWLRR